MTDPVEAARAQLSALGLEATAWSNGPGAVYGAHDHPRDKILFCLAGSITFHTAAGDHALRPGDRLDLPAGTVHTAEVGPEGVTCWEAYLG